jgi:hypothetical protein
MKENKEAIEPLNIAKTILLEFEKGTGYRNPLLKDVEDRIFYVEQSNQ